MLIIGHRRSLWTPKVHFAHRMSFHGRCGTYLLLRDHQTHPQGPSQLHIFEPSLDAGSETPPPRSGSFFGFASSVLLFCKRCTCSVHVTRSGSRAFLIRPYSVNFAPITIPTVHVHEFERLQGSWWAREWCLSQRVLHALCRPGSSRAEPYNVGGCGVRNSASPMCVSDGGVPCFMS